LVIRSVADAALEIEDEIAGWDLNLLRILREEFPNRLTECLVKSNAAGTHAVEQLAPCGIVFLAEFGHRE